MAIAPETARAAPGPASPYRGLRPYALEDAPYFFGRELERDLLVANLVAFRLTIVYGASGIGKTSLLAAGVLSSLRSMAADSGPEAPTLLPVYFNAWSDDPRSGLLHAVGEAMEQTLDEPWSPEPGATVADALEEACARIGGDLLLILDQFEEHFQYRPDDDAFLQELAVAIERPRLSANFLIAIRDDALARLDRLKARLPRLFDNTFRLEHLTREAARDAIERPLAVHNRLVPPAEQVTIDPELVDDVIAGALVGRGDAAGGSDAPETPVRERIDPSHLQLVMRRLWNVERDEGSHRLRQATLEQLGGTQTIVQRHLDEVMEGLPPAERDLAAAAFRQLVTPGMTKIAIGAHDLAWLSGVPRETLEPVLDRLAGPDARVLRRVPPPADQEGGEPRYEAAHDLVARAMFEWRAAYERERDEAELRQRLEREAADRQRHTRRRAAIAIVAVAALAIAGFVFLADRLSTSEKQLEDSKQQAQSSADQARASEQAAVDAVRSSLYSVTGYRPTVRGGNVLGFPPASPYRSFKVFVRPGSASKPSPIVWGTPEGKACDAKRSYPHAFLTWRARICRRPDLDYRLRAVTAALAGNASPAELARIREETDKVAAIDKYARRLAPILRDSVSARREIARINDAVHDGELSPSEGAAALRPLVTKRARIAEAARGLPAAPEDAPELTRELQQSMNLSLEAARAYRRWMLALEPTDQPAEHGFEDPAYQAARGAAVQAATFKQRFLREYNPLAEGFALRTFRAEDI